MDTSQLQAGTYYFQLTRNGGLTTKTIVNLSQRNGTLSTSCQVYGNLSNGNNVSVKVYQDVNDLDVYLFCDDYAQSVLDITHKGGSSWQTSQGSSVTPTGTEVYDSNDEIQFIINESGNVGIGTTSPSEKLDVVGNLLTRGDIVSRDTYPSIYVDHSGTVMGGIRADATNKLELKTLTTAPLSFQVNSSEKMRVTSAGNVGIGTTSPSYNLDVQDSTNGIIRAYGSSIGRLSLQNNTMSLILNPKPSC